jgi:hypothetical protein
MARSDRFGTAPFRPYRQPECGSSAWDNVGRDVDSETRVVTMSSLVGVMPRRARHRMIVGVTVLLCFVISGTALASSGFLLSGRTSQGKRVQLHISPDLSVISRLVIVWRAGCRSGATLVDRTIETGIPVGSPTRFTSRRTAMRGTAQYGRAHRRNIKVAVSSTLRGVLEIDGKARGTFAATARVLDDHRTSGDTCSTRHIHWKAMLQ